MSDLQNQPSAQPGGTPALPKSAMGIASLVLGIIALVTSFLPIVNNLSAIIAVLGFVFSIVGIVGCVRGKRSGKGLAIAALIVNVIAFVIVMATQSMYTAALDSAADKAKQGPQVTSTQSSNGESADYSNLAVGDEASLENGLSVRVDSVQPGLKNYDGSAITGITVTYTNNGTSDASFNAYDWKAQDAQGAQRNTTYYSEDTKTLSSGTLAPGGTVTGSLYFDGDVTKALYYGSMIADSATAGWALA